MTDRKLAATVTNTATPVAINVSQSHDSATAIASISAISTTLDVGDSVTINLGYSTGTTTVFKGYVKAREKKTPDGLYTITAHDVMTRAVDFFIVSPDSTTGYEYQNITAHALIQSLMTMAGLSSFDFDNTSFTLGINNPFEVNLVSSYDYSRMIADLIAWMVWADRVGTIHLKNRKPFPMDGSAETGAGQPGYVVDSSLLTVTDTGIFDISYGFNEKDLRNKVVIYGAEDLYAEALSATSYDPALGSSRAILPAGYYKTMMLASPLIDDAGFAQDACDYNLTLYNKLQYQVPITVEGNGLLEARKCITVTSTKASVSGLWYIFQCEHAWSNAGFITNLLLTK